MQPAPVSKYRPFPPVNLPNRQWPNRTLTRAPIWCSVDLRDGNQALAQPMSVEEKLDISRCWSESASRKSKSGFPAPRKIEFDFCRRLIEKNRIPDDVAIQILCQCREELITRSIEAMRGAKNAIFHLYNSTSPAQRKHRLQREPRRYRAASPPHGTTWVKQYSRRSSPPARECACEYSPESFTSTELEFALEICEAVTDVWQPTPQRQNHPEPSGDRRVRDAERPRRSDRVDVHASHAARSLDHFAAHAQRPRHRRRRDGARPCSPAPTASKARSSATANARATSIS